LFRRHIVGSPALAVGRNRIFQDSDDTISQILDVPPITLSPSIYSSS
jgi:hypothetical protein